ncbi:transcriptional regulator, LacI family [Streptomyces sp. yr375]|uniref:LacI family DNA-binding transcriptional regulator n=1 Tax=Streptomyces sp. yr375 TaxID=1761906 RepID=UPI0008B6B607|nr:LacI family DNA-binding transcriptional regulator [Streptomyces sp. yr375]SEP61089.1 transcriptional regulator, LacI family [Streptomyces sp. yr375]
MTEVARAAGVSQKTVSRVVNGEPHVSPEVRDRVLRAVRELDYRPNTAARALLLGRYRRIGVVSPGSALHGPTSLLLGLEQAVRRAGYAFALATTREGRGSAVAAESLLEQGVDGVVLVEPVDVGTPTRLHTDLPVVGLCGPVDTAGGRSAVVRTDGVAGARLATEHLLALGHRTVWHVPGPQNWFGARDRVQGWREALAAADAPEPALPAEGDWTPASGFAAGRELARLPDVTAVFAANDDTAIGLLRAFAEAGRTVPHDVSVVGFDDIPVAAYLTPPLTTLRQDFAAVTAHAVAVLTATIENQPPPPEPTVLAVELRVRDSTAPVRAHGRPTSR